MKDELGERMKKFYENRIRHYLTRRTYTIIRVDGKAFHTYTKNFDRPFDDIFMSIMNKTALHLMKELQGAKLAFIQSDEISILITDFDNLQTQLLYDGNIQKICSVSASIATAKFNEIVFDNQIFWGQEFKPNGLRLAYFDSRVFQIPTKTEVMNYFIWRQQDTVRNSISSVTQSLYSHKELNKVNCNQMQEMIFKKGKNWNDYESKYKRGRMIYKIESELHLNNTLPIFTQDKEFLNSLIIDNT